MTGENKIQERLTEIFEDPNIYAELREKIMESIRNGLYYSKFKDTHFYDDPTVFEQFVDVFIEDILNDVDFKKEFSVLNKLRNLNYTPRELYLFRRDNSGIKPSIDIFILNKIQNKERLTPDEEKRYEQYKKEQEELYYNNQLVLFYLEGHELNDEEQERMNKYLQSLMTEEDALAQIKIENEPKIKEIREKMKKRYFEKRLSKMPKRIKSISDPFELKEYERKEGIFKGFNGNTEFLRVEESSDKKSAHDFEVTSEYIIMVRNIYHIPRSYTIRRRVIRPIDHYAHVLLIYTPSKENEYPEGTHLSDLIRKEKETQCLEEIRKLRKRIIADGLDPDRLFNHVIEDEKAKN